MNNYILTDSFNWADEIDFSGFIVVTEDVLNKLRKYLNSKRGEIETFYIGTNEEIECDIDEYADYLEDIEPIDSKELEIIEKHLGSSIGETLWERLLDNMEYESDENEEEDDDDIDDGEDELDEEEE